MSSVCLLDPHGSPLGPPYSHRRWWLLPEQGGGDIVAVVFIQLIGGGIHLELAVFFFIKCVPCQSYDVPFPLELQWELMIGRARRCPKGASCSIPAGNSRQPTMNKMSLTWAGGTQTGQQAALIKPGEAGAHQDRLEP